MLSKSKRVLTEVAVKRWVDQCMKNSNHIQRRSSCMVKWIIFYAHFGRFDHNRKENNFLLFPSKVNGNKTKEWST